MTNELKLDTIRRFNDYYGFEHLNPMVTVGHFHGNMDPGETTYNFGVYAIFLKETKGCELNYGLTKYDFDEMSVTSFAPGQKVTSVIKPGQEPMRWSVLAFHPDFLSRSALGRKMSTYGFFSYNSNEALHLSLEEVNMLQLVLSLIERETRHVIDRHSHAIIVAHIEVFLDYCLRFYERQFYTREIMHSTIMDKFVEQLDEYIVRDIENKGLPTVSYFADRLNLSPGYFGELVKTSCGINAKDVIADRIVTVAREMLNNLNLSVSQVSYNLGFEYPQHFVRFFKRRTGRTPKEFRNISMQ